MAAVKSTKKKTAIRSAEIWNYCKLYLQDQIRLALVEAYTTRYIPSPLGFYLEK